MGRAGLISSFFVFLMMAAPAQALVSTVEVPAGSLNPFWLKPQKNGAKSKKIKVPKLTVQTHQVTNAEFQKFLETHPDWQKANVLPLYAESNYLDQFVGPTQLKENVPPESPVTSVSWFAAKAYCQSIGMRLPTASEWEYLAAASENKKDANRDEEFLQRILNWYSQPKSETLPKVKSIYKNLYGLHDMHGLVWEWVDDFNSNMVTGESREDSSLNRDLFCGAGSISSGDKENYAAFMRFAFRSSLKGHSALWNLGFRCVKGELK